MLPLLLSNEGKYLAVLGVVLVGLGSGTLGQSFFDLETVTVLRSWLVMGALTVLAIANEPEAQPKAHPNLG